MKNLFLFILILLVSVEFRSQTVFCPPGAEWHYSYMLMFTGTSNEQVKYVRDSVLGAETVKVLQHFRYYKNNNLMQGYKLTLIKQTGEVVYFRNLSTQDTWQVLYNFGATAGQSWQNIISLIGFSQSTLTAMYSVTVDSVRTININGFNLKRLYTKYWSQYAPSATGYETIVITERFGGNRFLFNFYNKAWETDGDFGANGLCYQDNDFGVTQFSNLPCNYIGYNGISETQRSEQQISASPNPVKNILNIQLKEGAVGGSYVIQLSDLCGRTLIAEPIIMSAQEKIPFDLSRLEQGVYLLDLIKNGKPTGAVKVIKGD